MGRDAKPSRCGLDCLSDPRLSALSPGLSITNGYAQVMPDAFPCCGGTGLRLLPDQNVTVSCDLGARLKKVRALLKEQGAKRGEAGLEREPTAAEISAILRRLELIATGKARRGLAFAQRAGEPQAPLLPTVAMLAAWRFGLNPKFVTFGSTTDFSVDEAGPNEKVGKALLLVDGVHSLWDPLKAEQLDAAVGYAYRTLTPLFVSFVTPSESDRPGASAGPVATRHAFRRRLQNARGRSPLAWLMPDCLAKLPAVTDGLSALRSSKPKGATVPEPPKLPWDP